MSRIIASAAIRGAQKIVSRAEKALKEANEKFGPEQVVEFPNTGYFLPVIYAMTGMEVRTIADMFPCLDKAKMLLPPVPAEKMWMPYLGNALDAGMATLFADEIIEVLKYLEDPVPYHIAENCPDEGDNYWLGAADDLIFRKRGLEFVDGTAPGFAAIVGCAPNNGIAVKIARELQEKNLYVFMTATADGKNMAEQLREEDVQMGWETRLVPFGKDITATVYPLGFAARVAMSFGGVQPGDYWRNLLYNKNRTFAFVLGLGEIDDEKYAQAAGAINFGFPAIADTDIPEILPTGVCTYEHVIAMPKHFPPEEIHENIVAKAIEVRGLKVEVHEVPIPVSYGPAFEGEVIRRENMYVEFGGQRTPSFEFLRMFENSGDVTDGKIELFGPEIDDIEAGSQLPLGIVVEVYGREMQPEFEPILERMIHTYVNGASGVWHNGQRDINWLRISKDAKEQGFKIKHLGDILHARLHQQYGAVVDKVQVRIYTNQEDVLRLREEARQSYHQRDARIAGMTDESVGTYYSCILCQSFAPQHVCIITPERSGLCGGYSWLDAKANYQIIPTGPNQPVDKGDAIDETFGQWVGVNEYIANASRGALTSFSAYSMIVDPMTSCVVGDTELIINGEVVKANEFIDRHHGGDTYVGSSALTLHEGKAELEPIVAVQRFKTPDDLIQLNTKSGTKLVLTPNHEIAVDRLNGSPLYQRGVRGDLQWIRTDQINVGDRLISLRNLELPSKPLEIVDILPDDFRVADEDLLFDIRQQLTAKYGSLRQAVNQVPIKSPVGIKSMSLKDLKTAVPHLGLDWETFKKKIRIVSHGASFVQLPDGLDAELFYIGGLIASDGSITKRGKYEYHIDFVNTDETLGQEFTAAYTRLFPGRQLSVAVKSDKQSMIKGRVVKPTKPCRHYYANNPVLGIICEHFGIQIGSDGGWNLGKMVNLPKEYIASFIAGIFDGDGSVRIRHYSDKWDVAEGYLCISDEGAARHLQLLLKRFGIIGNVRKSDAVWKVEMHGSNLSKFAAVIPSKHPEKRALLRKIRQLSNGDKLDKTQEQVLPYYVGKTVADLPVSQEILSPSTLYYYKTGRSRPIATNVRKVLAAAPEANALRAALEADYFLDIVTDVKGIKNNGDYDYVYNLTLADTHCYFANGALIKNCGCFECISAILPLTNGVMIVNREYSNMTPCGMKFSTLAGSVGGGLQTPGFVGHSRRYIASPKYIAGDGGFKRIVWMTKALKEDIGPMLEERAKEEGINGFLDMIADETIATTEEEVLEHLMKVGHPALELEPMI
ncbi:hypothetical protein FJZ31_12145 [Candidatus Poribacteria bacterium]|nr:hypothetical protein [Candidatus Poribacteria bacterium]